MNPDITLTTEQAALLRRAVSEIEIQRLIVESVIEYCPLVLRPVHTRDQIIDIARALLFLDPERLRAGLAAALEHLAALEAADKGAAAPARAPVFNFTVGRRARLLGTGRAGVVCGVGYQEGRGHGFYIMLDRQEVKEGESRQVFALENEFQLEGRS